MHHLLLDSKRLVSLHRLQGVVEQEICRPSWSNAAISE